VPYKSAIGDWLIPSHPTGEEVAERELEFIKDAVKQKDELQLLLHPGYEETARSQILRTMPVPEPSPRGVPVGRTLNLEKLEPRRQPKKHIQDLDKYEK
jgi:hypothetical protein